MYTLMLNWLNKYNVVCENVHALAIENAASIELMLRISRMLITYFSSKAEN